jgi:hypothetical protein
LINQGNIMKGPSTGSVLSGFVVCMLLSASLAADDKVGQFSYNYAEEAAIAQGIDVDNPDPEQLRAIFSKRRARVMRIPDGAMLVYSVDARRSDVSIQAAFRQSRFYY